jgi:phosphonate transport system substrate-binding protein
VVHIPNIKGLINNAFQILLFVFLIAVELINTVLADPLIVGIFPRRDAIITAKLFRPLTHYLGEQLALPVKLELSPNFEVFLKRLQARRYDLVHLNQYEYINARDGC